MKLKNIIHKENKAGSKLGNIFSLIVVGILLLGFVSSVGNDTINETIEEVVQTIKEFVSEDSSEENITIEEIVNESIYVNETVEIENSSEENSGSLNISDNLTGELINISFNDVVDTNHSLNNSVNVTEELNVTGFNNSNNLNVSENVDVNNTVDLNISLNELVNITEGLNEILINETLVNKTLMNETIYEEGFNLTLNGTIVNRSAYSDTYYFGNGTYATQVFAGQINMKDSNGEYKPYEEVTEFIEGNDGLILKWNNKEVRLNYETKEKGSVDYKVAQDVKLDYGVRTKIAKNRGSYYFDHNLNGENLEEFNYEIETIGVDCNFSNYKLFCDEQVIDFGMAVEEQNLTVEFESKEEVDGNNYEFNKIKITGGDLSYIDPSVSSKYVWTDTYCKDYADYSYDHDDDELNDIGTDQLSDDYEVCNGLIRFYLDNLPYDIVSSRIDSVDLYIYARYVDSDEGDVSVAFCFVDDEDDFDWSSPDDQQEIEDNYDRLEDCNSDDFLFYHYFEDDWTGWHNRRIDNLDSEIVSSIKNNIAGTTDNRFSIGLEGEHDSNDEERIDFGGEDYNSREPYIVISYTIPDNFAPTTSISAKTLPNNQGYTFGSITPYNVQVSLSCHDTGGSGCNGNPRYCVDTINTCNPSSKGTRIAVSNEGAHYIRYYSKDNWGNKEDIQSRDVNIQRVGDSLQLSVAGVNVLNESDNYFSNKIVYGVENYINSYLENCEADEEGNCLIPINLYSKSSKNVKLKNLDITYDVSSYVWDTSNVENSTEYKVRIKANDGVQESEWHESGLFSILNPIPVTILVNSPSSQTYSNSRVPFNIDAIDSDGIYSCWYNLDNSSDVLIRGSNNSWEFTSSISDGEHEVQFFCNDIFGNENSTDIISFSVDTNSPEISINSPLSETYASGEIVFNLSAVDSSGVDTCWYNLDSDLDILMEKSGDNWEAKSSISDGEHKVQFFCNDTLGNENNTNVISFNVVSGDANKFYVRNNEENIVAWLGDSGNILLSGTCSVSSDCENPSDGSFIVKNSVDEVTAYIDSNGNLCVESGSCAGNEASCNPSVDSFIIQDVSGNNMSYIDFDGKLCAKGGIHENVEFVEAEIPKDGLVSYYSFEDGIEDVYSNNDGELKVQATAYYPFDGDVEDESVNGNDGIVSSGTVLDSCDDLNSWTSDSIISLSLNSNVKAEGISGINYIGGVGDDNARIDLAIQNLDLSDKIVNSYVYIRDQEALDKISSLTTYFHGGSGWNKYDNNDLEIGWNVLSFDVSNPLLTEGGGADESNVDIMRFRFNKGVNVEIEEGEIIIDEISYGKPLLSKDRFGNDLSSYSFDSLDQQYKISIPNSNNSFEVGNLSFVFNFNPKDLQNHQYIWGHYVWRFYITDSKLRFGVGRMDSSNGPFYSVSSLGDLDHSKWYQAVGVYAPDENGNGYIKLYLDGDLQGETSIGNHSMWEGYNSNRKLQWANSGHGVAKPFIGLIYDSIIFEKIFADEEVRRLYEISKNHKLNDIFVNGKIGRSLEFWSGGNNKYGRDQNGLFIELNENVDVNPQGHTVSFWYKTTSSEYARILTGSTNAHSSRVDINPDGNILVFESRTNNVFQKNLNTGIDVDDGSWHNYVLMFNSTNTVLYVDGSLSDIEQASSDNASMRYKYISGFVDGQYSSGYGSGMNGQFDELGIWNKSLSLHDVKILWNEGLGVKYE